MIVYKQADTEGEIIQILALQASNLPRNLTATEIRTEGFLTVEHTFDLLVKMNAVFPHTIALHNEKVIGYALSMHPQFRLEIEILRSMFLKIQNLVPDTLNYLVMGQICIAKTHRGQGVFRGLYEHMKTFISGEFDAIITEVDVKNNRSLNAHKAVGFKELHRYTADEREWCLIIRK